MISFFGGWISTLNTSIAREIGQCCARLELDINKLIFKFKHIPIEEKSRLSRYQLIPVHSLRLGKQTFTTYGNLLIPYIIYTSMCERKNKVLNMRSKSKFYTLCI